MEKQDYYEILAVAKDADSSTIKAAYRKAAFQYHPDRNPGNKDAETKFKDASEAYEVLMDESKRRIYDRYGHQGLAGQGYSGPQDVGDIFSSFGSIFEDFFGFGGSSSGQSRRGTDLRYDLEITFKEAVFGVEKEISYERDISCSHCKGEGADPAAGKTTCSTCKGHGQIRRNQGFFSVAMPCSTCRGQGSVPKKICSPCTGSGMVKEKKKISVKIPAGVDSGIKLRVSGEGEGAQKGASYGDLYVVLDVADSAPFIRDGIDLILPFKISFTQAALGGECEVPTLEQPSSIKIPTGSQHGDRILIPSAGIPKLRGVGRGDLFVELQIEVPKKLSKEQKELLQKFAEISGDKVEKSSGSGFFQRIFE